MKKITIPNTTKSSTKEKGFKKVFKLFNYNNLDQYPWGKTDGYQKIRFKIAHDNNNIYLHYNIIEPEIIARYSKHNDPVCKDSCVEFFIAFEEDTNYYNFEFNCIGTCCLKWGPDRHNRQSIDSQIINLIKVKTKIKRVHKKELTTFNWKIFIKIPLKTFYYSNIKSLENIKARANFYKCGDDLSKPHYITWNNIKSENPDFHLKSYFGYAKFN
ncbi:carbohydrate-binding family 9-like protein [Mariniflexile sp.]|uniref:carbohydrate-binding family 9-like protein n=1 Tax=Mariniflexile sp. TaxID=1979402 RepID=UPI0040470AF8